MSTDLFEHPALTQQTLQIEQFIESIFPTQTAATYRQGAPAPVDKSGTTLTDEEQEAQKKQQAQDKEEFFYIMLAVGATLFVITAIMVRTLLQPPARLPLLTTLAVLHRLDDGRTL
jgi:farnesyl-diphosphate farnesyltransferase